MSDESGIVRDYIRLFRRLIIVELLIYWLPLAVIGTVILSMTGFWPGILMVLGAPAYRFQRLVGLVLMVLGVVLGTPAWAVAILAVIGIAYGELLRRYFLPRQRAILRAANRD